MCPADRSQAFCSQLSTLAAHHTSCNVSTIYVSDCWPEKGYAVLRR